MACAVDPEFIATSLEKKVFVKTAVPELLAGSAVLVVTRCVTAHLRAGGEKYAAAALMAKRLQHEECSHERPLHPHNCLFSLLSTLTPLPSPSSSCLQLMVVMAS